MGNEDGALTEEDLEAVWESAVDEVYADDLKRAGDGGGYEIVGQAAEQLARVARASRDTFQGFFVRPWSGQTGEPAAGPEHATVTLEIRRLGIPREAILLLAGEFAAEELVPDWGPEGTEFVPTGRRYVLGEDVALLPGEPGPVSAIFVAERTGAGFNAPRPNRITLVTQQGGGFDNDGASVAFAGFGTVDPVAPEFSSSIASARIHAALEPQVFVQGHVGCLVEMLDGANQGRIFRVRAYQGPASGDGGSVEIDLLRVLRKATGGALYTPGERVTFFTGPTPVGLGVIAHQRLAGGALALFVRVTAGTPTLTVTGSFSGVSQTFDGVWMDTAPTPETGTARWRVLRWSDLLTVTNPLSPEGGRTDMLDEIGRERMIERSSPLEDDVAYAERVGSIPDVVSPNAHLRAIARVLVPRGEAGRWREVGSAAQRGFFCDRDFLNHASWWADGVVTSGTFAEGEPLRQWVDGVSNDLLFQGFENGGTRLVAASRYRRDQAFRSPTEPIIGQWSGAVFTPNAIGGWLGKKNRYRWMLDFAWMRASFIVSLPRTHAGEAGATWDATGQVSFWDAGAYAGVWDGGPILEQGKLLELHRAMDAVRMGMVLFTIVADEGLDDDG